MNDAPRLPRIGTIEQVDDDDHRGQHDEQRAGEVGEILPDQDGAAWESAG